MRGNSTPHGARDDSVRDARRRRVVDRATWRHLCVQALIALGVVVVPGIIGVTQRPAAATEGWIAITLGLAWLLLTAWRAATAGFVIDGTGLRTRGRRGVSVPREDLHGLWFTTWTVPGGRWGTTDLRLHRLVAGTSDGNVTLTRHPLHDADRAHLEQALRDRHLGFAPQ